MMKTIRHQVENISLAILGVMILTTVLLFIHVHTRMYNQDVRLVLRQRTDEGTKVPAGVTKAGVLLSRSSNTNSGWVVRYTAKDCEFCRQDETLWNKLRTKLSERGTVVRMLSPSESEVMNISEENKNGDNAQAYTDVGWIRSYRLTVTPTTLLFNSRGMLLWSHQGTLAASDVNAAVKANER